MNTGGSDRIGKFMKTAVLDAVVPGAVLLCGLGNEIIFHEAFGYADIFEKRPMSKDTIFDLASLTKPLATTLAVAKLVDEGLIYPELTIDSVLPEFSSGKKSGITIDMLLRHRSGLAAHREYYRQIMQTSGESRCMLRTLLAEEPLEYGVDERQVYSDLGFMILSWVVESVSGTRLDRFVREQIYKPLGIERLFFPETARHDFFVLEYENNFASTQNCPWRGRVLTGEVDDENAWAAGGIEGHAGLFGDALSVFMLCCEILDALKGERTKVLPAGVIQKFAVRNDMDEMAAGFDTPSKENSSSGRYFSLSSVGHLGFTGTSFWIDPATSLSVILLTNRVHPSRSNQAIRRLRPEIHDIVYTQLI